MSSIRAVRSVTSRHSTGPRVIDATPITDEKVVRLLDSKQARDQSSLRMQMIFCNPLRSVARSITMTVSELVAFRFMIVSRQHELRNPHLAPLQCGAHDAIWSCSFVCRAEDRRAAPRESRCCRRRHRYLSTLKIRELKQLSESAGTQTDGRTSSAARRQLKEAEVACRGSRPSS